MKKSSAGCGCLLIFIVGFTILAAIGRRNAQIERMDADAKALTELTTEYADAATQVADSSSKLVDTLNSVVTAVERDRAKLLHDGLTTFKAAHKRQQEAKMKLDDLFSVANLKGFPGNRERLKPTAQKLVDEFAQSYADFHKAAANYETTSNLITNSKQKELLILFVNLNRKRAELTKSYANIAFLLTTEHITTLRQLIGSLEPLLDESNQRTVELEALETKLYDFKDDQTNNSNKRRFDDLYVPIPDLFPLSELGFPAGSLEKWISESDERWEQEKKRNPK